MDKALIGNTREVMKTRAGKDVIWNILSLCGIYDNCFTGNSQSFYLEGRRSVGLDILQMLEDADPTIYPRLILEKQEMTKEDVEDG